MLSVPGTRATVLERGHSRGEATQQPAMPVVLGTEVPVRDLKAEDTRDANGRREKT